MPYNVATLDGSPIFGIVLAATATPKPVARQKSQIFGQNGELAKYGGSRGYHFSVKGMFQEGTIGAIQADFAAILSFVGPGLHTYIDVYGNAWSNVIFDGRLRPEPEVQVTDVGWVQGYTLEMESLL
ncbi:MAG: hypothetical protein ACYDCP_09920 [Thermoplasmataceae archaeon]